jgi:hypothetical protein
MRYLGIIGLFIVLFMLPGISPAAQAANPTDQQQTAVGQTPPRLSFVDGQVSFWRPGAQDWSQAQLNTPLASGDQLYTGSPGNLELQIGSRAFVRAWADTQLGLENQEPDFLRFEVTTGYAAFDLRTLEPGRTVMVDTPNASFTIDDAGYYRVDVNGAGTSFITRRGGQAAVTTGNGRSLIIASSQEVVIEGTASSQITSYTAPPLDEWDNWNYARTDHLLETLSARYISSEIYGAGELDAYGTWRILSGCGPVWIPTAVPPGWVPYSAGAWIIDPHYGWTWVDTEPWGWAPYHYGRWVFVDGFWGWAPGPVQVRPVYAPALVAFFGEPGGGAGVAAGGGPVVGWVALGWGEPLIPWWGPKGFIHRPWWGGWGGPRVVNNRVINKTTVVNVQNITIYRNAGVHNALVTVNENLFGRRPIGSARMTRADAKNFRPLHTAPRINATPASFKPNARPGIRPPEKSLKRPVAAPRPMRTASGQTLTRASNTGPAGFDGPAQLTGVPKKRESGPTLLRLPSGHGTVERPVSDRAPAPVPVKNEDLPSAREISKAGPTVARQASPQPRREPPMNRPATAAPQQQVRRPEGAQLAKEISKAGPTVTRQASLQSRRKPQVDGPATVRSQLQTSRAEGPQRAKEVLKVGPTVAGQASPQSRRKPQVTGPATVRPQLQARRAESLHPQARESQGEQPNQLSANWVKVQDESGTSPGQQSKARRKSRIGRGESDGG